MIGKSSNASRRLARAKSREEEEKKHPACLLIVCVGFEVKGGPPGGMHLRTSTLAYWLSLGSWAGRLERALWAKFEVQRWLVGRLAATARSGDSRTLRGRRTSGDDGLSRLRATSMGLGPALHADAIIGGDDALGG